MSKEFWQVIDEQIERLRTATTADEVIAIIGPGEPGVGVGDAFFAGGGGDVLPNTPLRSAGWRCVWAEAEYFWVMQAPDGSAITYIEGDIYKGDRRGRSAG